MTTLNSNAPIRPFGLHPLAFAALVAAGIPISRVGQCIGSAPASKGVHAKDGEYEGHDYCAATDFRIKGLPTDAEAHAFCGQLAGAGFLPYYRKPGVNGWPDADPRHVHAIWPGCPMKEALRNQVHAYLHDYNGLATERVYPFRPPSEAECDAGRAAFLAHNPMDG